MTSSERKDKSVAPVDTSDIHFSPRPRADECMYSGDKLNGSVEHVLPDAIGSTLKSDKLIASRINALSSQVLEPALFKPLELPCYYLGIPGKKGERRLRLAMSDGRTVEFGPDLRPTILEKPKPKIVRTPAQTSISLNGTCYDQLRKVARTAAREDKDNLREVDVSVREEPLDPIPLSFPFDVWLWVNAIRKSALSLLGYFDPLFVRSRALEEARFLVFTAITRPTPQLPSYPGPALLGGDSVATELGIPGLSPIDHILVVSCEPATQRVIAFLRLFGNIDNAVVLSSTYEGPEQSFIYCRNPLSDDATGTVTRQVDRSCHAMSHCLPVSPLQWGDALRIALEKIMRLATMRAQKKAIASLPGGALPEWFVNTGSRIDSAPRFANSARAFVRDFVSVFDIEGLLDEPTRAELITALSPRLAAAYDEFSGKIATAALKRDIGQRWLKQLVDQFETALEATASKRGTR